MRRLLVIILTATVALLLAATLATGTDAKSGQSGCKPTRCLEPAITYTVPTPVKP